MYSELYMDLLTFFKSQFGSSLKVDKNSYIYI